MKIAHRHISVPTSIPAIVGLLLIVMTLGNCYNPPPRYLQDRNYVTVVDLTEAADRIVRATLISQTLESVTDDSGDTVQLAYMTYEVLESAKGSANPSDMLHVAIPSNLVTELAGSLMLPNFENGQEYILFLKGRARRTEYPAQYGGTLWTLNGAPAIAIHTDQQAEAQLSFAIPDSYSTQTGLNQPPFTATWAGIVAHAAP